MSQSQVEEIKRRYKEFLDLLPVTLAIAGLPPSEGQRYFTSEQMELRGQVLANAFKVAQDVVRDAVKGN